MKTNLKALATLVLVSALTAANAQTSASGTESSSSTKSTARKTHRTKAPAGPSVQSQIDSLRNDMQTQIQSLKQQLADRDAQLQQAQQAAAAAQAAAQQAQQAAQAQQTANETNTQAVSSLQGAVTDLKTNNATMAQSFQETQKQLKTEVEQPDAIRFKGVTLSPTGSYLAAETVYRNHGTAADIPTAFNSLPLGNADAAHLSEFYGSGRQSRIALLAEGKASNFTMRGYYEADWLGVGITSNDNQSNSYVLRQRQLWAQAERNKWTVTGGQMWSLATEDAKGITNRTEVTPLTIDPNYIPGFVWERQYGFRVVDNLHKGLWLGLSAENPETLNLGGTVPAFLLLGSFGNNGGAYNGGANYTVSGNAPAFSATSNYSFNLAPDMIVKAVAEPSFGGHYELFGIARFFHDRIYTGYSSTAVLNPTTGAITTTINFTGAYNDSTVGGGTGGSFRVPTFQKKLDVGLSGLWGDGISRYGDSSLSDATARYDGRLQLLHGYSALSSLTWHATPRLDVYANYGTDGVFRRYSTSPSGTQFGYGNYSFNNSGCNTEVGPVGNFAPSNPGKCAANNRDVHEFVLGYWYDFYKGPMGRLRQGIQYSYAARDTFSTTNGSGPKGTDGMFWTSFRYYLP